MSVIISTGSPVNGDGFVKASFVSKTEQELINSSSSELIFNSNYENTLEIVAIDEFPCTNSYTTYFGTGFSGDRSAIIIANSGSSGIFKDLFDYESSYYNGKFATFYYVYNKALGKSIALMGHSRYELQYSSNYPFTMCEGDELEFYTRWILDGSMNPSLYEIGISSLTTSSYGMEFINNMSSNVLVRVKLNVTINSSSSGFSLPNITYSSDISLSNKSITVNGNDISKTKYISVAASFMFSNKQFYPIFSHGFHPSVYSYIKGYTDNTYPGLFVNGHIQGDVSQFNSTSVSLTNNSLNFNDDVNLNTIPIFGNGVSPHYKYLYILDSSNQYNTITLSSSSSSVIILSYGTQAVFNGKYIQPIFMPYYSTIAYAESILFSMPGISYQAHLKINKSNNILSLSQDISGQVSGWNWTIKFWVFEYTQS